MPENITKPYPTNHRTRPFSRITIASDDPFVRQFVSPHHPRETTASGSSPVDSKPSKSMGLHLQRSESWGYAQAVTKLCGYNVFIPAATASPSTADPRCSTPTRAEAMPRLVYLYCQAIRTPLFPLLATRCAKITFLSKKFRLFRLFDSEPHGKLSINNSLFHDIVIPIAAQYSPSDPPKLIFTSDFTYRGPYIAVADICTCGQRSLAMLGNLQELRYIRWNARMRAMDVLIGRICIQDSCRIAVA